MNSAVLLLSIIKLAKNYNLKEINPLTAKHIFKKALEIKEKN